MRSRLLAAGAAVAIIATGIGAVGCGGSSAGQSTVSPNSAEVNPAGDIPDNQVFVAYSPPGAGYRVTVPEGWSRTSKANAVTFTDKLNSIQLEWSPANAAPTVAMGQAELKRLAGSVPGFKPGDVTTVKRNAGTGLLLTYTGDGPADPVTGKTVTDSFERYEFFRGGKLATLTLSGPQGADNVDPWMTVTDSLQWTP